MNLPPDHELAPGGDGRGRTMRKLRRGDRRRVLPRGGPAQAAGRTVKPQYAAVLDAATETVLWNHWAMVLLVGLLTLEWFLRKFNGLS